MKEKNKGELYAVKFVNISLFLQKADGIYEIEREAKTLRLLKSKYIVNLENYFIIDKEAVLVMEYCQGGEMRKYLNERGNFSETETQSYMMQII